MCNFPRYTDISDDANSDHVIVRFFGVFFLFFQTSSVFGNIISSTVLKGVEQDTNSSTIGTHRDLPAYSDIGYNDNLVGVTLFAVPKL